MPRPSVIIATQRPPLPLDNGSRIRTHRLAAGLRAHCDVTLVAYEGGPTYDDTTTSRAELEASLPGVDIRLVPYAGGHPRGARRQLPRRSSANFGHFARAGMREALARLVSERPGAVLQIENAGVGLAALGAGAPVTAFAPHNVEYRIVRDVARERGPSHRIPLEVEWRKMRAEEHRLYGGVDVCLAVSEVDAAEMRANGARRVELAPNGADPVEPLPWRPPAPGEPLRLMFVGTADYWPYELGVAWFVREALPRLRERGPVTFDVVGAPPVEPVRADGVTYHGRVPDVMPHYERAHALVIPVFQGSGTRLKIVESALLGRPVISTTLGAEGLGIEPGRHYLGADDAAAFADAATVLREQPDRVREISAAARDRLAALVWPRIASDLAALYAELLAQSTSTR